MLSYFHVGTAPVTQIHPNIVSLDIGYQTLRGDCLCLERLGELMIYYRRNNDTGKPLKLQQNPSVKRSDSTELDCLPLKIHHSSHEESVTPQT
jgi:hypothetical protein